MTYTPTRRETMQIPLEPAVLSIYIVGLAGSEVNHIVYIPWKNCKLVYAYTVCTTAEGNNNAGTIDLELNATGGSAICTTAVAKNATVGTIVEATLTTANCENLSSDNPSRDAINIEVSLGASSAWKGMLYMYFESYTGE